jgi:transposase
VNDVRSKARPNAWKSSGGRPTKLKATDKRNLVRLVTTGKANTATQLVRELKDTTNIDVCDDTIRNVLKEAGLKAITKKKKPKLSSTHIRQRLEFAKRYQYWTAEDWKCVIWSDETKVNRLGLSDGRKWTWKRPDSTLTEQHIQGTTKFGGGSLMMWGCMTAQGVGYACRIDSKMDAGVYTSILDDYLLPTIKYYKLNRDRVIFQQDNDSKHTSRAAQKWFDENQIEVLVWPPRSPDLSPIEHLWWYLKNRLDTYDTEPKGMLELWERLEIEWNKIPKDVCIGLIESMPKRIAAVLKAKGGYTKY